MGLLCCFTGSDTGQSASQEGSSRQSAYLASKDAKLPSSRQAQSSAALFVQAGAGSSKQGQQGSAESSAVPSQATASKASARPTFNDDTTNGQRAGACTDEQTTAAPSANALPEASSQQQLQHPPSGMEADGKDDGVVMSLSELDGEQTAPLLELTTLPRTHGALRLANDNTPLSTANLHLCQPADLVADLGSLTYLGHGSFAAVFYGG